MAAQANALKDLYDSFTSRMAANPNMDVAGLRDMLQSLSVLAAEPTEVTYADVDAGGVPAILATPLGARSDYAIVYSHGGGCVTGSSNSHRKLAAHLAKAAGSHALVVDYRLAPEHPFPAQIEDLVIAHSWLRANGYAPEHTATAGDSAGANLAITSVLKLRELGEPRPAAIVVISPWLDMEHLGKTLESNADSDAFISREVSEMCAALYLGETARDDPLANPLHADLTGMPPMYVCAGDAEALLDNAERIADRARMFGVDVTVDIQPGQQHVYPLMAGRSPQADATIGDAATWLRARLSSNQAS
jgi:acetyl esterase/lipase